MTAVEPEGGVEPREPRDPSLLDALIPMITLIVLLSLTIVLFGIAAIAALAVVALLVWGDRESGVDDRDTDPEDVVVTTDAASASLTISIDLE